MMFFFTDTKRNTPTALCVLVQTIIKKLVINLINKTPLKFTSYEKEKRTTEEKNNNKKGWQIEFRVSKRKDLLKRD